MWLESDLIETDEWHHVAVVYEQGVGRQIYIDGEVTASDSVAVSDSLGTDAPLRIGYTDDYSRYFNGGIDQVRVYERALEDGEIKTLAAEFDP